ncbi:MAG: bacteriohemerythrin [Gammaproteobacteria bacterium]|nr:bacteriohemerythrin [Gammaproteobacteria bacterium]
MESFIWNNNFVTGLSIVDEQHRNLVNLINKFSNLLSQNELIFEDIESVYTELAKYATHHFREEEELMISHGIDQRHVTRHKNEHRNFLKEVSSMHIGISPEKPEAAKPLLKFLIAWLAYHILCTDQNMARQAGFIQSGVKADKAYDQEEKERDSKTEPLLASLNSLFEQVSSRNLELVELNQTLEVKVAERTSELTSANLRLEEIAITDVLTGLPNRRYGMQQLELHWNLSQEKEPLLACMMIDADGFKEINDTYGHDAGDVVLKELSRTLSHSMRTDDIVCRLGGDEFFIICPDTSHDGAMYIAEAICKAINELHVAIGEGVWHGSISIGVAARSPEMGKFDALLKLADDGLYVAKKAGKNCVKSIQSKE